MDIVLSVIIPVYKVEDYLCRCIDSILQQDYEPMEIILVDDGSPDRCPQICDEYARKNSRIKVIHKPNGGASSARNAGIKAAVGRYLLFVDSDDQWNRGLLEHLISKIEANEDVPMTFFSGLGLYSDGRILKRLDGTFPFDDYRIMNRDDYYSMIISHGNLHEGACTVVMLTDYLIKYDLYFKEGITGEDTEWMFRCLRCADRVAVYNVPLYIYTLGRPGSITHSVSSKNINDVICTIKSSFDYYELHKDERTKQYELAHCAYLWATCLGMFYSIPKEDRKRVKQELKALRHNLVLKSHPKTQIIELMYAFFGFSFTAKILHAYIYLHEHNIVNRKKKYNG